MTNPNDSIRNQILQWFYERNNNATSQYGKKGSAVKISDVKKGLKDSHGLSRQQVMSNLTYLTDKGWINKNETEKTVKTKSGTIPSTVHWYEISSSGIDKIEGESEFKEGGKYAGINIEATGMNVITLGDGNVVNADFQGLHSELMELRQIVSNSNLGDEEKLNIHSDIETLSSQLAKQNPDKTVVSGIWESIKVGLSGIDNFTDIIDKVHPLVMKVIN
ncbi:MAG: hypothetical protein ACR2NQ_03845 [Thermodesulfobacteriota bacterium]